MADADTISRLAIISAAFFVAGFVKGTVAVGLPTVTMGLLGAVMAPREAAALLVIPAIVTNIWQAAGPGFLGLTRRIWPMFVAIAIGIFAAIGVLTGAAPWLAMAALGIVLAAYGVFGLAAPNFALGRDKERWATPVMGLLTGVICGSTGVFVVPSVPYLSALSMTKDELVQAVAIVALVSSTLLGIALGLRGAYTFSAAWSSAVAVIPALVGMAIGQAIRNRLEPEAFRRWFFLAMVGLGVTMIVRAWGH